MQERQPSSDYEFGKGKKRKIMSQEERENPTGHSPKQSKPSQQKHHNPSTGDDIGLKYNFSSCRKSSCERPSCRENIFEINKKI